jgi:hypothetical protein
LFAFGFCGSGSWHDGSDGSCWRLLLIFPAQKSFRHADLSDAEDEEQLEENTGAVMLDDPDGDIMMEDADSEVEAAAASSNSRRLKRTVSARFSTLDDFITWFIDEHHITQSTTWNGDLRNLLTARSSRAPLPCPNLLTLESKVRAALRV